MARRPAIPSGVVREILIESGHRCAVCGATAPLERAHIVRWNPSQDHSAENLICLCANCHYRADIEDWGEKVLRQYKANPWVLRHQVREQPERERRTVTIELDISSADLVGERRQTWLRNALAAFLDISPESVTVKSVEDDG